MLYRLYQYLQERMDFISVIINSAHNGYSFYAPLNLKAGIPILKKGLLNAIVVFVQETIVNSKSLRIY